jgi:hypothetical protein
MQRENAAGDCRVFYACEKSTRSKDCSLCRSRLAGDGAREITIASKPAPTVQVLAFVRSCNSQSFAKPKLVNYFNKNNALLKFIACYSSFIPRLPPY